MLDFRWYTTTDYSVGLNRSFDDVVVQENMFQVGYISCAVDENSTIKSGQGLTGIATSNFLMTQEILDGLYAKLKDMSYHPTTCSFAGDMRLELGDIVQVLSRDGKAYPVPVMSLDFSYDGGLITAIGSYGSTELSEATYVSPTENYVQQVYRRLYADKLDAKDAAIKYAQIDFANIGKAALEQFFAKSGLIEDVVVGDQKVTGTLVGVTILGDSIKGGTVIADKLVIKGEDGLYYKLNTDGNTVEKEQTDYNSLDGGVIRAKSITATKIAVDDLVAFGATIGGWHIADGGLYSGAKESMSNTSRGTYLGSDGQINIGDSDNFIMFYVDNKGESHLAISADKFTLGKQNIEDVISDIKQDVDNVRDEITTLLRIESSRGTVFKNNAVSTVLSVVIYHGKDRITDIDKLHEVYGSSAYIQWKWQKLDEEEYGIISSADSRMSNDGFSFTLSPDDVDTKVTFMCELITD